MKKKLNSYKEVVEKQKLDIKRLHQEVSDHKCRYLHFKRLSDTLTAELISLKSKFENADFHFKKFDCSSEKVEKMINA